MGGFTLYETLRILVPGVITTLALDFALRVGFGPQIFGKDGGVEPFVDFVESTAGFTGFSLAAGLLLYMIDVPVKIRVSRGDAKRDRALPSDTLRKMLEGSPHEANALSLYFTLTDQYLPEEMRKRVYLFGSLYRIYVDLRFVAVVTFVTCSAASTLVASRTTAFPDVSLPSAAVFLLAAMAVTIVAIGSYGVRRHTTAYRGKHAADEARSFARQLWLDVRGALAPAAALLLLGGGAAFLLGGNRAAQAAGIVLAVLQLALWTALEIGPPQRGPTRTLREWAVRVVGGRRDDVQFAPIQRLAFDLFMILPWLVAAAGVNAGLGRDPAAVLAWGALLLPATVVVSFRKHEERLLGIYKEQSVWLKMHEKDVDEIRKTGLLPDRWE